MSRQPDVRGMTRDYLARLRAALDSLPLEAVEAVVARLYAAYREGRKVLIVGNGGSAATASHMACDLAKNIFGQFPGDSTPKGRFKVLSLTDNVPLITAWANDAGYERVFLEQVRTFTDPGDVLVAISGSGNSPNVVEAVKLAKAMKAETIGILGFAGGKLKDLVDTALIVASDDYGPVEDVHMALDHIFTVCLREMIDADSSA
jgi:D-sedoheptulose 7-phosphate isomerase